MLIRFNFSNFKSYKEDTSLLLTSCSKIRTLKEHVAPIGSRLNVLKFAGIYGDNASGKTNVLLAAEFFKMYTAYAQRPHYKYLAFKGNEDKPTSMEAVFSIDGEIYQYGFSLIRVNEPIFKTKIVNEYLNVIGNKASRSNWIYDSNKGVNEKYNKGNKLYNALFNFMLNGYKEFNKNRDEVLFLTFINQKDKVIKDSPLSKLLAKIYNYIKEDIIVIGANTYNLRFIKDIQLNNIKKYTKEFDSGLEDIKLEAIDPSEIEKILPGQIYDDYVSGLKHGDSQNAIITIGLNQFIFASKVNNDEIEFKQLLFKHKYLKDKFYFDDESEGTRRFVTLMSYFTCENKNATFFIDEVERSMHPSSVDHLFDFCERETRDNNNQFIFSTHNVEFMSHRLRRDEIYLVEKDVYSESIIYPLTEFVTRSDSNLAKMYLEGAFNKVHFVKKGLK